MSETLHLGCGTDIRAGMHNVDKIAIDGVDEVVDLEDFPWPWERNEWDHILANHVFEHFDDVEKALRETQRILKPNETAKITVPIGMNAVADPDHKHVWIYDTPEYYCGKRHWDIDVGLRVQSRSVELHPHLNGIGGAIQKLCIEGYERFHGQGRWMFDVPITSGEFTVVFVNDRK